ncbi:4-hydroxy-tetrahydrodipicolinate reductase [Tessaracoccus sp. ZS01]|uniref:4-hydroxy-tetrahydrodipicolinate reductase n=1 Tax=Tessaracoccus sp. ZS01 TaxID=1906324 RepID=UPI00096EE999|nr:4-hydroxy-tetrahydrodipicolinate reductase [Tessaracoccus sp. ZS01]MCG6566679.1 4-hydroxy-tetrahydrodipicolinate reductase [Tessaracoccus sp. ZS01]OMG59096.1 4-hydroxy-tetrahydrodipicolinate reductase [Tessaracoccus sp. ZS01]
MREIRVGIFGVSGKMGSEVVRAVNRADDMATSGGVDINEDRSQVGRAEVVVDFTHPDAVMDNIRWCLERDINMVIGTTGFTQERVAEVRALAEAHPGVGVLIASNFSIGAVLMMKFAAIAAPFYPSVEIVELHHPNKADAPSGTATTTAHRIARARAEAGLGPVPDATVHDAGARGAVVDGIHIHGVRLQGLVAHQEVLLGETGETLTIRHDSFERVSFMPGVLEGIRYVMDNPGLTLEMDKVLGL